MLLAYIGSVLAVLGVFAAYLEWRAAPLPVPHQLFYLVAVSLPYQWRSGFLLMPIVAGTAGLLTGLRSHDRPGVQLSSS